MVSSAAARLYAEIYESPSNCGPLRKRLGMGDASFAHAVDELTGAGYAVMDGRRIRRASTGQVGDSRLSAEAAQILDRLMPDGTSIGGLQLRSVVRLTNDRYQSGLAELKSAHLVRLGRGRGGTVARVTLDSQLADSKAPPVEAPVSGATSQSLDLLFSRPGKLVSRETELYQPFVDWYQTEIDTMAPAFGRVRVTASPRGYARGSGQWTRPDVVAVEVRNYDLLPSVDLAISSFEIKRAVEASRLQSIYEAVAHGRVAQLPNLVVEIDSDDEDLPLPEGMISEALRQQIGLYTMYNTGGGTFRIRQHLEPAPQTPDPGDLQALLEYFFSQDEDDLKEYRQALRS